MVSLPPNQETMKVFSLDDKLDPNFERPVIRQEMKKGEEVKVSKFQMLKKKFADVSSALKTKLEKLFEGEESNEEEEENDSDNEDESNEKAEEVDEEDGNLFSDANGNIYYIDKEGHVYKCQEKNGEYHLEEYLGVYRPEENEEEEENENQHKYEGKNDEEDPQVKSNEYLKFNVFGHVRINHENKEKKSIIEELTFDLESTDDTEEEKNGGNLSKSSRQKQNKVHILKEKGDIIDTTEMSINIFKISKEPKKKKSFLQFIMSQVPRYIYFEEGIMYVMCQGKRNTEYKVKSVTSLDRLFKVYLENKNQNKIRLAFFNQQYDYQKPPLSKMFVCEKKNEFLISLKNEMHKLNKEMKVEIL